jgi:hypothetical protein
VNLNCSFTNIIVISYIPSLVTIICEFCIKLIYISTLLNLDYLNCCNCRLLIDIPNSQNFSYSNCQWLRKSLGEDVFNEKLNKLKKIKRWSRRNLYNKRVIERVNKFKYELFEITLHPDRLVQTGMIPDYWK